MLLEEFRMYGGRRNVKRKLVRQTIGNILQDTSGQRQRRERQGHGQGPQRSRSVPVDCIFCGDIVVMRVDS